MKPAIITVLALLLTGCNVGESHSLEYYRAKGHVIRYASDGVPIVEWKNFPPEGGWTGENAWLNWANEKIKDDFGGDIMFHTVKGIAYLPEHSLPDWGEWQASEIIPEWPGGKRWSFGVRGFRPVTGYSP